MRPKNDGTNQETLYLYDLTPPLSPILSISPMGNASNDIIFDWEDGTDRGGIANYTLIVSTSNDLDQNDCILFDITINNAGENRWH